MHTFSLLVFPAGQTHSSLDLGGFAWVCTVTLLPQPSHTHFPFLLIHFFFLNWLCFSFIATLFIYFWLCWVFGSCEGFLQLRQAGATLHCGVGTALHRGARAFHYRGPSRCGAQAPDVQAQQLWLTGPAAPRHVGSSQTRARTRVPCISRQILNHCATREALLIHSFTSYVNIFNKVLQILQT